jgi:hypothetical protein
MSILYIRARPIVAFDATKQQHREWYYTFVEKRSWGHCPVRFMVEGLNTDLLSHINSQMMAWYISQEFKHGKRPTKDKTKNSTKPKSKGAPRTVRSKQSVPSKTSQESS